MQTAAAAAGKSVETPQEINSTFALRSPHGFICPVPLRDGCEVADLSER